VSARWLALLVVGAVVVGILMAALRELSPPPASPTPHEAATPETAVEEDADAGDASARLQTEVAPAVAENHAPVPCEGCIDERAAIEAVAALLHRKGRGYLEIRAEVYADIPWLTPDRRWPPLPPDLEGAPSHYSLGPKLPRLIGAERAETWVVWFQTGRLAREKVEEEIWSGDLPPVARAWPPLKLEDFLLVDARSGDVIEPVPNEHPRPAG